MRVAGGNDKLNLDLVRSVEINYTCTDVSFEGTDFVCWPSRDHVLISPRSCVDFVWNAQAEIVCQFRSERSSRDRVSISPRSCVDFVQSTQAEIVC